MIDYTKPIAETNKFIFLDKFDAPTNSITEGLPCEIELRQKQYEYYRDQLLSFPKMEGFTDITTGEARRGLFGCCKRITKPFPNPEEIEKEKDKKDFVKLFGEYI